MQTPLNIVHFHNGTGGGVYTVIKNLLRFSKNKNIRNHIIHAINRAIVPDFELEEIEGAYSQQVYEYTAKNNFYHTCRQMSKLLPENAIIVAHDWVELGMVSNLGLQNQVIQFVHGNYDYYYDLAVKHKAAVNKFICISPAIQQTLTSKLSDRAQDILLRYFPVPPVKKTVKQNGELNILFVVRDLSDENKNFPLLAEIDKWLTKYNLNVKWVIVGRKGDSKRSVEILNDLHHVVHYPYLENDVLLSLLPELHIYVLPSIKEGLPVSLIESMKGGLVPICTNWGGSVELLKDETNGYYVDPHDSKGYADRIRQLHEDRDLLNTVSLHAIDTANKMFDAEINTLEIEQVILEASGERINKPVQKVYGSRLDHPVIPNSVTRSIRSLTKK